MYLYRAFVFGLSARAILAIAALALSVGYALIAGASLSGLGTEAATIDSARLEPGWVLVDPQGAPFSATTVANAVATVTRAQHDGVELAAVQPWPYGNATYASYGLGAATSPPPGFPAGEWLVLDAVPTFGPVATLLTTQETLANVSPELTGLVHEAYVEGAATPQTAGLDSHPWQGVDQFYDLGAKQLRGGLVAVVLASGAIASLLSGGFAQLEVLARARDLGTIEALAGPRLVRKLVALRVGFVVATGLVVGTAVAWFMGRLAGSPEPLSLGVVAATWAVTGIGGVAVGVMAARRVLRRGLRNVGGGRLGTRPFRGPIRFLLVTPRLSAAAFTATLVGTAILAVVIQSAAIPIELFGAEDAHEIILQQGGGNPLRGTADRFVGEAAWRLDGVAASQPETFVPTVLAGRPLMARGTSVEAWERYADPQLVDGRWPTDSSEALVGARAARIHDLALQDRIWLPAAYHRGGEAVIVVGVFQTGDLWDDEMVLDLEVAGRLAGLPSDQTNLVRLRMSVAGAPWAPVDPGGGIAITNLRMEPPAAPPLSPATVIADAINFGPAVASRDIAVRFDSNVSARTTVELAGHARTEIRVPVVTPANAVFSLKVNPEAVVVAGPVTLRLEVPEHVAPGERLRVRVFEAGGPPVVGAAMFIDGHPAGQTAGNGSVTLRIPDPSLVTISARAQDKAGGALVRVAPAAWESEAHLVVENIFVHPAQRLESGQLRVVAEATFANLGGIASTEEVEWRLDNETVARTQVAAASGHRAAATAVFELTPGPKVLELLDRELAFDAQAAAAHEPTALPGTIEELLALRAAEASARPQRPTDATNAFLDDVFDELEPATRIVVLATLVHSAALIWIAVARETTERRPILVQLRALGASDYQLEGRAIRDASLSMLLPVAAGMVVANGLLVAARYWGLLAGFGHALPGAGTWGVMWRAASVLFVLGLVAAFVATHAAVARRVAPAEEISLARAWRANSR